MIRSELVLKLAEANPHLYKRDVEAIVTAVLDAIAEALARGDRVEIRGFCALSIRRRRAHAGLNPRTGEKVTVSATAAIQCRTGKGLERRLNPGSVV
jgi:integration host factor subunit beta